MTINTLRKSRLWALSLLFIAAQSSVSAQEPRWVDPAMDLANLPTSGGLLTRSGDAQIISFRNIQALSPTRTIEANDFTLELPVAPTDFADFHYQVDGKQHSLDQFMIHNDIAGLLVLKDGKNVLERYGLGNDEDSLWVSFSMAKSVVSMLVGAAIKDGYIHSVDDKVTDYLPQMKGSAYDQVSIRNVLQMASGVQWNEDYTDPNSDVASSPSNLVELFHFLGNKERVAVPGERFNYNTGETNLAGAILRAAIGNNLATYLTYKIWQPFGMESDATWQTHGLGNGELGGCCINATLRDFGRLGLFAMSGGVLADGTQVLPQSWMQESTTPSKGSAQYGYLWWLEADGVYRASGIFGQGIYINPANNLVVVALSAWRTAQGADYAAHRDAVFQAIDDML
jgi:CubicO group peptidase (beta-lactamase class C family)